MPTPDVLVKYINIGALGLGSDPRAGQITHCVNKVTVAEMGPATRYTVLRIIVSIIKV